MIVLLCLTQVFLYMPNNAQGAIIISGIVTLFDYKRVLFLFSYSPPASRLLHAPAFGLDNWFLAD